MRAYTVRVAMTSECSGMEAEMVGGHADKSEMRAEELEMIGDGWGCVDEAYHDMMHLSLCMHPCIGEHWLSCFFWC